MTPGPGDSSGDADLEGPGGAAAGSPGPPRSTPLLGAAWKILAALAAFLLLVLAGGFALPGTWSAERETVIAAPPDSVFGFLDALESWDRWTPWPDVEVSRSGPARGEGATMTWDDPFAGDGRFTLVESVPPERLAYRVEVEGGSMVTRGVFRLEPAPRGTRVVWKEEGDFGWNPLMGYAALTMDRVQGVELERGLARLRAVVETGELPDSLRAPDRPAPTAGGDPPVGSVGTGGSSVASPSDGCARPASGRAGPPRPAASVVPGTGAGSPAFRPAACSSPPGPGWWASSS